MTTALKQRLANCSKRDEGGREGGKERRKWFKGRRKRKTVCAFQNTSARGCTAGPLWVCMRTRVA